jgi:thiol-disulfide isomerase/thioredoxin
MNAVTHKKTSIILALALTLAAPLSLFAADSPDTHAKGEKPLHISEGQEVKLSDYLVPGKTTIFDFYSKFCPPCRAISPRLEKLHETHADIAVVKVDINRPDVQGIDWNSPVARQFDLHSIPHFKVFGPDGKLRAEGDPAYDMVAGMLD